MLMLFSQGLLNDSASRCPSIMVCLDCPNIGLGLITLMCPSDHSCMSDVSIFSNTSILTRV